MADILLQFGCMVVKVPSWDPRFLGPLRGSNVCQELMALLASIHLFPAKGYAQYIFNLS